LNCIDSNLSDSFKNKSTVRFNTIAAHKIKIYLENNARDYFNLDDISRNIGLSKFKMLRLFKQSFGTTPLDFFHMQKISLAKIEIINSPDKSFSAISTELGYESLSTFTKTFKKYENLSPSQFKKTIQK
jgi:AraC-like DNA-binding protein